MARKGKEIIDNLIVALDYHITSELRAEGMVNELVHTINSLRKKLGFAITDRVVVNISEAPDELKAVVLEMQGHLCMETLADYVHVYMLCQNEEYHDVVLKGYDYSFPISIALEKICH